MSKEPIDFKIRKIQNFSKREENTLNAFYNKNLLLSKWSNQYFSDFFSNKERNPLGFFVEIKNEYVGLVLGRLDNRNNIFFNINTLLIDPKYQREGWGKKMMEKIIREIKKIKTVEKIYLHFRGQNKLENFYAKIGFANHKLEGKYSNGDIKHYMDLKI